MTFSNDLNLQDRERVIDAIVHAYSGLFAVAASGNMNCPNCHDLIETAKETMRDVLRASKSFMPSRLYSRMEQLMSMANIIDFLGLRSKPDLIDSTLEEWARQDDLKRLSKNDSGTTGSP